MKRAAVLCVVVLCLLILQASRPGVAQEKQIVKQTPKVEKPSAPWEPLPLQEGVQVLRLWKTAQGPVSPQIAILRLSEGAYRQFQHDPLAFINKHGIFDRTVHRLSHTIYQGAYWEVKSKAQGNGSSNSEWVVVGWHMPDTTGTTSASPAQF